jgi:hypothetical protein
LPGNPFEDEYESDHDPAGSLMAHVVLQVGASFVAAWWFPLIVIMSALTTPGRVGHRSPVQATARLTEPTVISRNWAA